MTSRMIFLAFLCLGVFNFGHGQKSFNVLVARKLTSYDCTMGYLFVNDIAIGYTLELPWKDNKNNISCIPIGSYEGLVRYDKKDGWRIQLANVPGRPGIQLHMGNYTSQITGCVLLGNDADINSCSVSGSALAYSKLKETFYGSKTPNSTPDCKIIIIVK